MTTTNEERMEEAMKFFSEQAAHSTLTEQREMYEHLHDLAALNQLNARMLDVFQRELEEVRHELGAH